MANQYISKVVLGTETLIDLTDSTVTPATLMLGTVAYGADGSRLVGTATGGDEGSAYQDEDGYIVLGEGESSVPQGNISITANGTYDVTDYAGASVDIPTGATNVVSGEFTASTAGDVQEVSVSYSGDGWPVAILVFPKDGYFRGKTLYDTNHRYAIIAVSAFRYLPSFNNNAIGYGSYLYKLSTTDMTVGALRINGSSMFNSQSSPTSSNGCVVVRDKNGFVVLISSGPDSYGFLSGVDYNYVVVYSS